MSDQHPPAGGTGPGDPWSRPPSSDPASGADSSGTGWTSQDPGAGAHRSGATSPYGTPAPDPYATGAYGQPTQPAQPTQHPGAYGSGYPGTGAYPGQQGQAYPGTGYPGAQQSGAYVPASSTPAPGGYGYDAAGAYPPGGVPGYPTAWGGTPAYPGPAPARSTDGLSIAALVTGLLGLAVVPLGLGIAGLRRVRRTGASGGGMAVAGIVLGALQVVVYTVLTIGIVGSYSVDRAERAELRTECADGNMASCDELYRQSPGDSDDRRFGDTCGGRTSGGTWCEDTDVGTTTTGSTQTYGDDAELDALWDACESGSASSCDNLYMASPGGTEYEDFGDTCGWTTDGSSWCANDYGDDPDLDALWDACTNGDLPSCDNLYLESRAGSRYEDYGNTCGDRTTGGSWCRNETGLDQTT